MHHLHFRYWISKKSTSLFYSRYVSNDAVEENPVHQSVTAEIKKYDELTVEKEEKPKPKPTRQKFKKASDVEIKLNTGMVKIILSLVVRKPVFGVSDQVRHITGCTVTEAG